MTLPSLSFWYGQDGMGSREGRHPCAHACGKHQSLVLTLAWSIYCLQVFTSFILASSQTAHGNTPQKLGDTACMLWGTRTHLLVEFLSEPSPFSVYSSFILHDAQKHSGSAMTMTFSQKGLVLFIPPQPLPDLSSVRKSLIPYLTWVTFHFSDPWGLVRSGKKKT